MLVSYIIATWNRRNTLKRHLEFLMEQTWPEWFEVIVCDDGSTDGTQEMLAGLKNTTKYTIQWQETFNLDRACPAQSRNNGIRAAKGGIIIMVDDDCLPHRNLIESYVANFRPNEVQVGYRSNHQIYLDMVLPVPIEEGTMTTWWEDWQVGKFGHFTTNCCAMSPRAARIPAKDGSLGFDERFVGYGHEDTEFAHRLKTFGFSLVFNPNAVVWHVNPSLTPQQENEWKEAAKGESKRLMDRIDAEPWPVYPGFCNITGMMTEQELRWLYQTASKMTSVVELGSWQGRSTHALLSGCQGTVYSIDHWDPNYIGIPDLNERIIADNWKAFCENLKHFTNLQIIKMPSVKAATGFRDKSVEMVFVDADHKYESVIADVTSWLPKATKMICGHDYDPDRHPGVVKAVDEVFGKVGHIDTIWFKELI
jgi:glycosyltransferase involved in cell wall biosynthesis